MAVCQMNAGQRCLIRCCSDYGFSSTRRPPSVPVDAPLFFLVRVLRWEKEKNLHEMSLSDKFDYCDRRRELGKDLFAQSKPLSASRQYDKALTVLESVRNHEVDMKTVQRKNDMATLFLVNQAQSDHTQTAMTTTAAAAAAAAAATEGAASHGWLYGAPSISIPDRSTLSPYCVHDFPRCLGAS